MKFRRVVIGLLVRALAVLESIVLFFIGVFIWGVLNEITLWSERYLLTIALLILLVIFLILRNILISIQKKLG